MAIISIPTSIGGVTIPGAILKGPLGKLYQNDRGTLETVSYPRDLGSAAKGHVVQFTINEIIPVGYEEGKEYNINSVFQGVQNSVENVSNSAIKAYENTKGFFNGIGAATKSVYESTSLKMTDRKTKAKAIVNLYMPDSMEFTNAAAYSNLSLKDVAEEVIKTAASVTKTTSSIASGATSLVNSNATKLALATQGLAINPQQQLLFDGIDFREYQMAFIFTPFSKDESDKVKRIIQLFKMHAAPRIVNGTAGMFFIPPSTFTPKFLYNGQTNTNIAKVGESVIQSIDVNYAPNGWSAHNDGAPVQITMTISFKEMVLVTRDMIETTGEKGGY